jgi:UDP-3-O-[3-hydroxymyristoyl] glucosamine N-acyltransferase
MADRRFFANVGPLTLGDIAERCGARIEAGDAARRFADVAPLDKAGPDDISFLDNRKYIDAFGISRAGAVFVQPSLAERAPAGMALLVTTQPYIAYARAAAAFYPEPPAVLGIAATAVIDPSAEIGEGATIGHHVVVAERVRIGRRCRIGAGTVIGPGVVIGDDSRIASQVTLSHCLLGNRVSIFSGVRIGQDGFGFAPDPKGHVKVPQLGRVIIEDDVEIGANTTVDRGAGPDTVIGAGSMIDNLVQIGHNVVLGRGCVLAAQVGIAGSTKLGDFVMAGGQVGIAGHLRIGRGAKLAAQAGIMRDVPDGETVAGYPAVPFAEHWRQVAAVRRLVKKRGE